jgi:RNA polymerase sigma-70 factor (ECF subfamily)
LEGIKSIIEGCIKKEPKYQRLLYDRYRGYACKIVFRYIYRYENAMDVVTDGFIKALNHFESFKVTEAEGLEKMLMGWLKRIMINCSIDALRKSNMIPEIGGIPEEVWEATEKKDDADQLLLYRDLIGLIKELPPNYHVVFNLYVLDGYSHTQIAELLNISISTSRSSLSRAKALLQNQIKNMEEGKLCRI